MLVGENQAEGHLVKDVVRVMPRYKMDYDAQSRHPVRGHDSPSE
jgi:hypothetical protein